MAMAVLAVFFALVADDFQAFDYVWHWRKWRGDRKGDQCRVLARGKRGGPHNILVEFEDGERVVAPRYAVRKARQDGD